MGNFNQTLNETKAAFSYDVARKPEKVFCKMKTIKPNGGDLHGLTWKDRVILDVLHIDYDYKSALVRNPNGLEWVTKLKNISFCNADGSPRNDR
ncbi:MAG: hypothetical protein PHD00_09755 [Bacteroidales bacterium]|nr:hypothetical protein [Bacteroidales bacterium]